MTAPALIEAPTADPMAAVRALNRMGRTGFTLRLEGGDLAVSPFSKLTDAQRAYLRAHKAALVNLLIDAETVHAALVKAGAAGLAWMEGTPADWSPVRLLAADEVLYSDGRMVTRWDRRYLQLQPRA